MQPCTAEKSWEEMLSLYLLGIMDGLTKCCQDLTAEVDIAKLISSASEGPEELALLSLGLPLMETVHEPPAEHNPTHEPQRNKQQALGHGNI